MKFFKDNWKVLSLVFIAVLIFPIILILFFYNNSPFDNVYGSNDAWIGFWGSYAGGLMTTAASGGLAYYISSKEVETAKEEEKRRRINSFKSELLIKDFEKMKNEVLDIMSIIFAHEQKLNRFLSMSRLFLETNGIERDNISIELIKFEVISQSDRSDLGNRMKQLKNVRLPSLMLHGNTSFYKDLIFPLEESLEVLLNFPDSIVNNYSSPLIYMKEKNELNKVQESIEKNMPIKLDEFKNRLDELNKLENNINRILFKQLENLMYEYLS